MRSLAVVLLAAPLLALLPPAAHAADQSACATQPPTLVVGATGPAVVTGTEGDDVVVISGGGTHEVHLLGGDDTLCVNGSVLAGVDAGPGDDEVLLVDVPATVAGVRLDGGAGTDRISPLYDRTVELDLGTDRLVGRWGSSAVRFTAAGFEDAAVASGRATVVGDRRANRISLYACRATVAGGPGGDTVRYTSVAIVSDYKPDPSCQGRFHLVARGGPGNDRLVGRRYDDVLVGGKGHDVVDGRGGDDVCVAEVRRNCS